MGRRTKQTHEQSLLIQIYQELESELGRKPTGDELWTRYDEKY